MSPSYIEDVIRLVGEVAASDARAMLLIGHGRFFSGGLALPDLIDLDRDAMRRFIERFSDMMFAVFTLPIPVIAAINGHAIAGGCVLALQADWRIMADGPHKIGLSEVSLGIGIPIVAVEALRAQLPAFARHIVAQGAELMPPNRARALHLVDEVAPADSIEPRALERARAYADKPTAAYAHVKTSLRRPAVETIRAARADDTEAWLDTWFSAPAQQQLRAVVESLRK